MNKRLLSPLSIFRLLAAGTVLSLAVLACGMGAGAPAEELPIEATIEAPAEEPAQEPEPLPTQGSIPSTPTMLPTTGGGEEEPIPLPAITEKRRLTIEFPSQIRAGDSDVIRLTLELDDLGNIVPTAQFEGNVVTGDVVIIPDLYETHNVIAEAKFDIAGLEVSPAELISQTLSKGQAVNFYWSVRPTEAGTYRGTVWFYLRFVDKVSGEESQKTVSAQIVEVEAVNFLGLPANLVRTAGGIGSIVGAIVGFPFFEDIVKFVFRRRTRKK
ncbi:MAG: hypothetical protein HGA79_01630 [Anaerolineales bacterium]|nr:hypothetical protein [Anaerolineales bacterium]